MYKEMWILFILAVLLISSGCTSTTEPITGSLGVSSVPLGAEIYLDGVYHGTTPATVPDLSNGTYFLELRLRDYEIWTQNVDIRPGDNRTLTAWLTPRVVPTPEPTFVPGSVLGCWKTESQGRMGTGENFIVTEIFQFKRGGGGELNQTFIFDSPRKPQNSVTAFLWTQDPATKVVTITYVGGGTRELQYTVRDDSLTASFISSPLVRVTC